MLKCTFPADWYGIRGNMLNVVLYISITYNAAELCAPQTLDGSINMWPIQYRQDIGRTLPHFLVSKFKFVPYILKLLQRGMLFLAQTQGKQCIYWYKQLEGVAEISSMNVTFPPIKRCTFWTRFPQTPLKAQRTL